MRVWMLFIFIILPVLGQTIERPNSLRFVHLAEDAPWIDKEQKQKGLDIQLIKLLQKELNLPISLKPCPVKRCKLMIQEGVYDGFFSVSFHQDIYSIGVFPPSLDTKTSIHHSEYSLYLKKDSTVQWNGKMFKNLERSLGVTVGFPMVERFKRLSIMFHAEANTEEANFQRLLLGRVSGVVAQTFYGDYLLKTKKKFAEIITKHPIPVSLRPYFLVFSFKFYKKYPKFALEIWSKISKVRESKEYKKALKNMTY